MIEGNGLTFTVTVKVLVHALASIAVALYMVVVVGDATTTAVFVELKVAPGDQLYVKGGVPPTAFIVNVVVAPLQIVNPPETELLMPEGEIKVAME